jgi:hypothetical protein
MDISTLLFYPTQSTLLVREQVSPVSTIKLAYSLDRAYPFPSMKLYLQRNSDADDCAMVREEVGI